jgi:hypothetical protein
VVETPTTAAPPVPAVAEPTADLSQSTQPEAAGAEEPKKRNVVVRVFGKIFHKKPKQSESALENRDQKSPDRSGATKSQQ